jgi:ribosomal protein S18 acetylase RimI-like enzyme
MEIKLCTATIDDLDECLAQEQACFLPSEAASSERIELRLRQYPEGFVLLLIDDHVRGMINSCATNKEDISDESLKELIGHDPGGEFAVIFSFSVYPYLRGRGYARMLQEHFATECRKRGQHAILLLYKNELVAFYEKLGYKDCGLSASTHGGFRWHQMRFDLAANLPEML